MIVQATELAPQSYHVHPVWAGVVIYGLSAVATCILVGLVLSHIRDRMAHTLDLAKQARLDEAAEREKAMEQAVYAGELEKVETHTTNDRSSYGLGGSYTKTVIYRKQGVTS